MPIYQYELLDKEDNPTGIVFDKLMSVSAGKPIITNQETGERARKCITAPARMSQSWAEAAGTFGGVNGHYHTGLGVHVSGPREADKIAAQRGLVNVDDLPAHYLDDATEMLQEQHQQDLKADAAFKEQATKLSGGVWR